jgi:flagellar biosynthesis anti-sigma factor FlgM
MQIPEKGPLPILPVSSRIVENRPQPAADSSGVRRRSVQNDTVSLTEPGQHVKAAVLHARSLPEIREDRVVRLKRQLEEGSYRVKGDRIAEDLINETLENNNALKPSDTDE